MAKTFTDKNEALADWDNQERTGHMIRKNKKVMTKKFEEQELRAFIKDVKGDMYEIGIETPTTKPMSYTMLLTMISAVALSNDVSFESLLDEMLAMKNANMIGELQ